MNASKALLSGSISLSRKALIAGRSRLSTKKIGSCLKAVTILSSRLASEVERECDQNSEIPPTAEARKNFCPFRSGFVRFLNGLQFFLTFGSGWNFTDTPHRASGRLELKNPPT